MVVAFSRVIKKFKKLNMCFFLFIIFCEKNKSVSIPSITLLLKLITHISCFFLVEILAAHLMQRILSLQRKHHEKNSDAFCTSFICKNDKTKSSFFDNTFLSHNWVLYCCIFDGTTFLP